MHHALTFHHEGLTFTPHYFNVPLDYADQSKGEIEIFARAVRRTGDEEKPWLVYFQGGPALRREGQQATADGSSVHCNSIAYYF